MNALCRAVALLCMVLVSGAVAAQVADRDWQSSRKFGLYELHYSVFPSLFLSAENAERYGLLRGPDLGVINISLRQSQDGSDVPAKGEVSGEYSNLLRTLALEFREREETGAIYYLANFVFGHRELLRFLITVTPQGEKRSHRVQFRRRMYRDDR